MTALRPQGMEVVRVGEATYSVRRETREAAAEVTLQLGNRVEPRLATSLAFFDHMLEMLCWYGKGTLD